MVENSTDITIEGGGTDCPRCGGFARWMSGTFDTAGESIVLKSGPQWSRDLVEHLRLGLQQIVEERPPDPYAAFSQLDGALAEQIEEAVRRGLGARGKPPSQRRRRQLWLAVAATLWSLLNTDADVIANNIEHIRESYEWIVKQVAATGRAPDSPPSTTPST